MPKPELLSLQYLGPEEFDGLLAYRDWLLSQGAEPLRDEYAWEQNQSPLEPSHSSIRGKVGATALRRSISDAPTAPLADHYQTPEESSGALTLPTGAEFISWPQPLGDLKIDRTHQELMNLTERVAEMLANRKDWAYATQRMIAENDPRVAGIDPDVFRNARALLHCRQEMLNDALIGDDDTSEHADSDYNSSDSQESRMDDALNNAWDIINQVANGSPDVFDNAIEAGLDDRALAERLATAMLKLNLPYSVSYAEFIRRQVAWYVETVGERVLDEPLLPQETAGHTALPELDNDGWDDDTLSDDERVETGDEPQPEVVNPGVSERLSAFARSAWAARPRLRNLWTEAEWHLRYWLEQVYHDPPDENMVAAGSNAGPTQLAPAADEQGGSPVNEGPFDDQAVEGLRNAALTAAQKDIHPDIEWVGINNINTLQAIFRNFDRGSLFDLMVKHYKPKRVMGIFAAAVQQAAANKIPPTLAARELRMLFRAEFARKERLSILLENAASRVDAMMGNPAVAIAGLSAQRTPVNARPIQHARANAAHDPDAWLN